MTTIPCEDCGKPRVIGNHCLHCRPEQEMARRASMKRPLQNRYSEPYDLYLGSGMQLDPKGDWVRVSELPNGGIITAAYEWAAARGAFLALPAGSPNAREALNRLADAENDLYLAVRS